MRKPTYSLRTNIDGYENGEISEELFDEIISGFNPDEWDFMVLSPDTPINGCTFIQVGAPDESAEYQYTLEIGFDNKQSGLKNVSFRYRR